MRRTLRLGLTLVIPLFAATNVLASDDESFTNYEAIVSELKASAEDQPLKPEDYLAWDEVAMHGGMSLATSYVSIAAPNGAKGSGLLKGFEVHLGANLFSKKACGEFAFRNYAPEQMSGGIHADLNEFETRLVFLPPLRDRMLLRMGFGLAMRYLHVEAENDLRSSDSYKTSSAFSSLILGFEHRVSPAVSVGPDFSYRSALESATLDNSAWDAAIRLNATF